MNIGLPEVLVVLLILLLIFGGRRIPELGRALGTGLRNLRHQIARRSPNGGEIDAGQEPPRPTSAEPADDEPVDRRS